MSKLPVVSGREAVRAFRRAGWVLVRWEGSHMILIKSGEDVTFSVPDHKELGKGLLRALIRDGRLTVEEFAELLR